MANQGLVLMTAASACLVRVASSFLIQLRGSLPQENCNDALRPSEIHRLRNSPPSASLERPAFLPSVLNPLLLVIQATPIYGQDPHRPLGYHLLNSSTVPLVWLPLTNFLALQLPLPFSLQGRVAPPCSYYLSLSQIKHPLS